MKANELRIGNYVNFEQTTHVVDRIANHIINTYWIQDKEESDIYLCELDQLKPIPLTEEWIVAFGFNLHKGAYYHPNSELMLIKNNINNYSLYSYSEVGEGEWLIYFNLQTVHKLQNLFYVLEDEELTIK